MLTRTASTVIGLVSTGLPILFGIRKDLNEEYTQNTTDTTDLRFQLMHEQLAEQTLLVHQQQQQIANLAMLVNETC